MPTIYMDESGYTGQDLFNAAQPAFVLASTDLSDDEANEILDPIFRNNQGDELKHSRLGRRPIGQNKVVALVRELQRVSDRVTFYFMHKRFVIFQKLMDQWLEPVMHQTGHNFYERGENIAFCNMAFTCLTAFEGQDFVDEILRAYQAFILKPTEEKYHEFWGKLNFMARSSSEHSQDILKYILVAPNFLSFDHAAELGEKPQDISLTAALNIVSYWRKRSDDPITLIHDQSSNMAEEAEMWEAITSPDLEEALVGHGDHREMQFPLNVVSTSFEDSKSFLQLQVCDLIAGAMATFCHSRINEDHRKNYGDALDEAGIQNFAINGIWPSADIQPTDANPNHGQADPLDFMGGIIAGIRTKE